jgi:hypothetical protein
MNVAASSLLFISGGMTVLACRSSAQEIDRAEVERIITTLSADGMEGRRVFSLAIERAARFIQDEFAAIELETLGGLDGYAQSFKMYSRAVATSSVVLNGRAVPSDRYAARVAQDAIRWTGEDDVNLVRVGKDDDFMQMVRPLINNDANSLVLVDGSHRSTFDRLKGGWDRWEFRARSLLGKRRQFVRGRGDDHGDGTRPRQRRGNDPRAEAR